MEDLNFVDAFECVRGVVKLGNNQLSSMEFWTLASSEQQSDLDLLNDLLYSTFEISRISSHLLQPFCPTLSKSVLAFVGGDQNSWGVHPFRVRLDAEITPDLTKKVFLSKID